MGFSYRISWLLAVALAHHLEVDEDSLADTDRVDLERLLPLSGVFGAFDDLDFGHKLNLGADAKAGAFVGLSEGAVADAV